MSECVRFTEAECRALYEFISRVNEENGTTFFADDGSDSIDDPATRAAAKLFAAVGKEIPENLRSLVASVDTLDLPYGLLNALKTGHQGLRGCCLPRQITAVCDLCEYTAKELLERGVLWDRAIEDIRAALAKRERLKLKGD